MIKFFRKIRYNLLSENKTGKYLKYAVGEIVLVVIGILIALGINNWNEHRKDLIKEQNINNNLYEEFSQNLKLIDAIILESTNNEKACYSLMKLMNKDIEQSSIKKVDSLIYWAIQDVERAITPSCKL